MTDNVIIKKQKIKLRTFNEQSAFQLRKQLNDSLQYDLIAVMNKVFAQNLSPDIYLNIDKLKIDLGIVSAADFEHLFTTLAETKLINELQKLLQEHEEIIYTNEKQERDFYNKTNHDQSLEITSLQKQEVNALMFFLEKGVYPWWYKKEIQKAPWEILWNLQKDETESLISKIFSAPYLDDDKIKRIVTRLFIHLPEAKNENLVFSLIALSNNNRLINNVETLIGSKEDFLQLFSLASKEFYRHLFQFLLTGTIEGNENIIHDFIIQLQGEKKISFNDLKNRLKAVDYNKQVAFELKQIISKENKVNNEVSEIERVTKSKKKSQHSKSSHLEEQSSEGIYIENAGLVLLHPFLHSFFKEAQLLDEQDQFISSNAQHKAAVLLYYLQCGNEQYKEWEMALNKIFCGIIPDEVIADGLLITELEKENARALLQSAANYWEALKGASAEALQNTFLLREGKITWKEYYWLIQIEQTGVDILLDKLPWSFNIIKLPWLNHLIYVEW